MFKNEKDRHVSGVGLRVSNCSRLNHGKDDYDFRLPEAPCWSFFIFPNNSSEVNHLPKSKFLVLFKLRNLTNFKI